MAQRKNSTDLTELLLKCMAEPDSMLSMLEWLCAQLMEAEVSGLAGAEKNARNPFRSDYRCGYRPRRLYNLVPNLTVTENIEVVSNISKAPLDIDMVLNAVGLEAKKRSFPRELSGGEQQRAAIARAIVKNPKLLLCDEPTGALDYETSRGVLSLLQKVNRDFGTTVLMITHNTAIGDMANVVYRLRGGEIVETIRHEETAAAERIEW